MRGLHEYFKTVAVSHKSSIGCAIVTGSGWEQIRTLWKLERYIWLVYTIPPEKKYAVCVSLQNDNVYRQVVC